MCVVNSKETKEKNKRNVVVNEEEKAIKLGVEKKPKVEIKEDKQTLLGFLLN